MVIEESQQQNNKTDTTKLSCPSISKTVRTVLLNALLESRVIVGLHEAINSLSKAPQDSLFCFLAPPSHGDSATHMHEVLLQAFCLEHGIYIIKVDSSEKLSRIVGSSLTESSCAIIQKAWATDQNNEMLSSAENDLADHCEYFWDAPRKPVIRLPEL